MNILVIDDDKDFLYVLAHNIRKRGHTVFTAICGHKAMYILSENKMDLVISDVIMAETPIMSLTCTLKTLYPGMPILLISGIPTGHLISKSISLGADGFLPKPINLNNLFTAINSFSA